MLLWLKGEVYKVHVQKIEEVVVKGSPTQLVPHHTPFSATENLLETSPPPTRQCIRVGHTGSTTRNNPRSGQTCRFPQKFLLQKTCPLPQPLACS